MWLNENAGVIIFAVGIVAIVMLGISLWILFEIGRESCRDRL